MELDKMFKSSLKLFTERKKAYKDLKNAPLLGLYLVLYLLTMVSTLVGVAVNGLGEPLNQYPMYVSLLALFVMTFILLILVIVVLYGLLHLCFKIFGGKGSFEDTLRYALAIGIFPSVVTIFLSLIPDSFYLQDMGGSLLLFAFSLLIVILVLIVWTVMVSLDVYTKVHKLTIIRTFFSMLLATLFIMTLLIILVFLASV